MSEGICSNIFKSWLGAMAEYFKVFVFIPDLEVILATTPDHFRQFNNLGIIDCSEVFIETPKNLELGVQHGVNINMITPSNFWFVYIQIHQLFLFQSVILVVYLIKH